MTVNTQNDAPRPPVFGQRNYSEIKDPNSKAAVALSTRWLRRSDGVVVLQTRERVESMLGVYSEWRDVPMAEESDA